MLDDSDISCTENEGKIGIDDLGDLYFKLTWLPTPVQARERSLDIFRGRPEDTTLRVILKCSNKDRGTILLERISGLG